jgi:hypothetical protein
MYPLARTTAAAVLAAASLTAAAQTLPAAIAAAQTQPATDYTDLQIQVTGVEGHVQVRDAEDKPWRKATPGETVTAGAEFRTGPRSAVRCFIAPDQTFTIDRLGVMKVLTALQQGGKIKTDVAMKYGRTRYDIEEAGVEHESTIRSPSGVLALRGTRVSLYDQPPFTPSAVSLTGRAEYRTAKRQVAFGGKGQGKTTVNSDTASAAETAANMAKIERVIDPKSAIEMTQEEADQLIFSVAQGGIRFDRLIIGGFQPPPKDFTGSSLLPGKLNFVATWTGFADVDLFVIVNPGAANQRILGNPSVSRLFPGVIESRLPSGARIDFDKVSTQKGDFEIAYWPSANYQGGLYGIGAVHHDFRNVDPTYAATSDITLEVYQDGKKLDTVILNPDDVLNDLPPILGTTYQTKTDLDAGRDNVATVVIVPDPTPAKRTTKRSAADKKPAPAAIPAKVIPAPAKKPTPARPKR